MLTDATLERLLDAVSRLSVGVLGDLFLDRYLDIDGALTEPSIETGLDAYQVARVRGYPGAAGTVINNLAALGVKTIFPVAVIGDDGEGYELRQALAKLPSVDPQRIIIDAGRRTPTYTKPMFTEEGKSPRELNRLDIKNRAPLPSDAERRLLLALDDVWPKVDALLVLDQVSEADCGVVTGRVRERLARLGKANPDRLILADSRARVGLFRNLSLKPNFAECRRAVGGPDDAAACAAFLAKKADRPVFCTVGEEGIILALKKGVRRVPAYPVRGPVDVVGAGDSTSAGIACALAAGATPEEAAAFGNLVASVTIQQLGTTGTASPRQVRQRWREVTS